MVKKNEGRLAQRGDYVKKLSFFFRAELEIRRNGFSQVLQLKFYIKNSSRARLPELKKKYY
jgi:hypothetical protein